MQVGGGPQEALAEAQERAQGGRGFEPAHCGLLRLQPAGELWGPAQGSSLGFPRPEGELQLEKWNPVTGEFSGRRWWQQERWLVAWKWQVGGGGAGHAPHHLISTTCFEMARPLPGRLHSEGKELQNHLP